jgi:hypothetical protein
MYLQDRGTKTGPVTYFFKKHTHVSQEKEISFVLRPTGYITMSLPIMEPLMVAGGTPGLAS